MSGPPTRAEIRTRLVTLLETNFRIAPSRVTETASFRGTLSLDSSDLIDFVDMVEGEFGLKQGLDGYERIHNMKQLVDFISTQLANGASAE